MYVSLSDALYSPLAIRYIHEISILADRQWSDSLSALILTHHRQCLTMLKWPSTVLFTLRSCIIQRNVHASLYGRNQRLRAKRSTIGGCSRHRIDSLGTFFSSYLGFDWFNIVFVGRFDGVSRREWPANIMGSPSQQFMADLVKQSSHDVVVEFHFQIQIRIETSVAVSSQAKGSSRIEYS